MRAREDNGGPIAHPGAVPADRVREARRLRRRPRLQHPPRVPKRGPRRRLLRARRRGRVNRTRPAVAARLNGGGRRVPPSEPKLLHLRHPRLRHRHRHPAAARFSVGASQDRSVRRSRLRQSPRRASSLLQQHLRESSQLRVQHSQSLAVRFLATSNQQQRRQ
jgi:hypothetical protein